MEADPKSPDAEFYLRKAAHFRDKAKVVSDARLKTALEATAREYELRASHAGASMDPKAGKSNPTRSAQTAWHPH